MTILHKLENFFCNHHYGCHEKYLISHPKQILNYHTYPYQKPANPLPQIRLAINNINENII